MIISQRSFDPFHFKPLLDKTIAMAPDWIKYFADICKYISTGFLLAVIDITLKINKGELALAVFGSKEFLVPLFTASCFIMVGAIILRSDFNDV